MNIKDEFSEMVREITTNKEKTFNITTRDLLGYFYYEKRSSGNKARIDEFLKEKKLSNRTKLSRNMDRWRNYS